MPRWGKTRKERAKETKPRKKRVPSSKPRKKRVVNFVPICPPHDPVALAGMRNTCSPVLRRNRLLDFTTEEMVEYAEHAGVDIRTARRDRGRVENKCHLDDRERKLVLAQWEKMVNEKDGTALGHADCTQEKLRDLLKSQHNVIMSRHQLQRLLKSEGVLKPPGPVHVHQNNPDLARSQIRKGLAARKLLKKS